MKTVFILIGLKGSGKTYAGKLLSERLAIPFLRVEDIFLKLRSNNPLEDQNYITRGYENVEKEIRSLLNGFDELTIESTGIAIQFREMISNLKKDYDVKLIKIDTDPELCIKRVKSRNRSGHIPVSDEMLIEINKLSESISYDYDLIFKNNNKTDDELIFEFIKAFGE